MTNDPLKICKYSTSAVETGSQIFDERLPLGSLKECTSRPSLKINDDGIKIKYEKFMGLHIPIGNKIIPHGY